MHRWSTVASVLSEYFRIPISRTAECLSIGDMDVESTYVNQLVTYGYS